MLCRVFPPQDHSRTISLLVVTSISAAVNRLLLTTSRSKSSLLLGESSAARVSVLMYTPQLACFRTHVSSACLYRCRALPLSSIWFGERPRTRRQPIPDRSVYPVCYLHHIRGAVEFSIEKIHAKSLDRVHHRLMGRRRHLDWTCAVV